MECPPGVTLDIFVRECKFFELPEELIYQLKLKAGIIPELEQVEDEEHFMASPTKRQRAEGPVVLGWGGRLSEDLSDGFTISL